MIQGKGDERLSLIAKIYMQKKSHGGFLEKEHSPPPFLLSTKKHKYYVTPLKNIFEVISFFIERP